MGLKSAAQHSSGDADGRVSAPTQRVGWVRAARLRQWAHFLLLPLAGYTPGLDGMTNALAVGRGVGVAFAVLAFGYLINGVADRHMDASAKNPLAGRVEVTSYAVPLATLAAVAVAGSLLGPPLCTIAVVVALASGAVYSVGPRIKRLAVVGTLANATSFAPLLWVGQPNESEPTGAITLTAAFVLLLLQNQLIHEAADSEEDRAGRLRTTFGVLGPTGTAIAAAVFGVLLVGFVMGQPGGAALTISVGVTFALGFPMVVGLRGSSPTTMATVRIVHRVASLAAGAVLFALLRLAPG